MNRYTGRRQSNFSKWLVVLNIIVGIVAVGMVVSSYTVSKNIISSEEAIQEKNTIVLELEQELPALEEEIKELEQKVERLEQIWVRHSPTVIPDSMK